MAQWGIIRGVYPTTTDWNKEKSGIHSSTIDLVNKNYQIHFDSFIWPQSTQEYNLTDSAKELIAILDVEPDFDKLSKFLFAWWKHSDGATIALTRKGKTKFIARKIDKEIVISNK